MIKIALYSEDSKLQSLLSSALGKDFQIFYRPDEDGINALIAEGECDVLLLDFHSNRSSLDARIASARRIIQSHVPAVVLADDSLRSLAAELVREGAYNYCRRPPSILDLKTMLRRAQESSSLKRKLKTAQQQINAESSCDRMIGYSPLMREVYDLVHRVASLNTSVLVTGESGTGKELIARAIHNLGNHSGRPFVAVSCGAIPETLIEAELFGHEKGAFTGTVGMREGYLEQAGDGTLFLDEIGELSLSTQVKLLRVLQQREFSRLGSNRLIPLRARLVFATHQDLSEMVANGRFRQDLYYRINVIRIDSPALQDRPEDIPLLVNHFLEYYAQENQTTVTGIDADAMALLQNYSWPGNVRELENVLQRALIIARNETIGVQDLPFNIQQESAVNIEDYRGASSFEKQLRDYKIKLAAIAVRESNGNKTIAARSLQISRAYLHRLIRLAEEDAFVDRRIHKLETA